MKLTFQKKYISIDQFNEIDLPSFTVLTGINGSGKSHLLEAIKNRSVLVDGRNDIQVVRFDYLDFFLDNEAVYNAQQITEERNSAWNFFQNKLKSQIEVYKKELGNNYEKLVNICETKNKNLFSLTKRDIVDGVLLKQYQNYKKQLRAFFHQDRFKSNKQVLSIAPIIYQIPYSLDLVTSSEFESLFKPYEFKNDFLPSQLGHVIWNYYIKYRKNEVNEFQNEKHGKTYPVLTEDSFIKKHGSKPWEIINEILESFNSIEYRIPSPENTDYFGNYKLSLKHLTKDIDVEFSALSSGEKVLMALIASIYKVSSDNNFPDILLLDEIDTSLHPSMIKNLLEAINNIFLKNDVKVILVTHSPTTVALVPDESIYLMNKEGLDRVVKKTKSEALTILTEGFATLEEGLRIFDEISKKEISILSEGKNVEYIQKALKLNGVDDVEVIIGTEDRSGDTQLNTIFYFLSRIQHSKKVVIVWDSDINNSFTDVNNTYPFILPKNTNNKLAEKGIENLFDESLFNDFKITVKDSLGHERQSFDSNRKRDFLKFIMGRNNKDDFNNFQSLIDRINEIRNN